MHFDAKLDRYIRSQEKAARRETVRIENPLPGGKTRLKVDAAVRHVQRGAAEWSKDGKAIRFTNESVSRVMRSCEQARRADALIRSGVAQYPNIKGLPCTKPMDLIAPVRKRYFGSKRAVWKTRRNSTPPVHGPQEKP